METMERIAADAQIAAKVHEAEATLNRALRAASDYGLDAEATTTEVSVIGRGRCVLVQASVRRRI